MQMVGRTFDAAGATAYRYGFNGKENDNEIKGEGNQQDYGMRIYDPRLGKFLSVDPLSPDYPMLSPYQFGSNRPIDGIDYDGLEWRPVTGADGNIVDYTWAGFNANGSAFPGTVSSGAVVKNGVLFTFGSLSISGNSKNGYQGYHSGSIAIDDGSNVVMNATIYGNSTLFNFSEVDENGKVKSVFESGYLGNASGASGEDFGVVLNKKYQDFVIENTPRLASGAADVDGLGPFDFLFGSGEAKLMAGSVKLAAVALMKAEARHILKQAFTKVEITVARRAAVRKAWSQEKALVELTGKGTRNWSKKEIQELLEKGKVKGYQGHHINSVNGNARLAGNPDNIKFVKGSKGNLAEHGGNFQNPTSGPLISRKPKKR